MYKVRSLMEFAAMAVKPAVKLLSRVNERE